MIQLAFLQTCTMSLWTIFALCLSSYLVYIRSQRYRRLQDLQTTFSRWKESSTEITPLMAQKLVLQPLLYDMPFLGRLGAQVALFKTYGISTISQLLLKTGELTVKSHMSKRVTDTAILISSVVACPLYRSIDGEDTNDPRSAIALARVNWLHGRYRISNDDMLYTLSLFVLEPMRLIAKFDWRPYSPEEQECMYIIWQEIGRRMGIQDIPETLEDLMAWSGKYENQHMVPSESSRRLAELAINHISQRVPNILGLPYVAKSLFISLLDERLRVAMMLPEQPRAVIIIVGLINTLRAWIIRHCCLPRRNPSGYIVIDNPPSSVGPDGLTRWYTVVRQHNPWYFPAPTGWRKSVSKLKIMMGLEDPEHYPGPPFKCEGYRLEELGPLRYEADGHNEVLAAAEAMYGAKIPSPWARQT